MVAAGANPIQITRGIEKTTKALVSELKLMSKEVDLGFLLRAFMKLNCKCLLIFFLRLSLDSTLSIHDFNLHW